MEVIKSILLNMWYSIEPFLAIIISIGTLIAVIYGFSKFNVHTRNVEEVRLYQELRDYYSGSRLRNRIRKFFYVYDDKKRYYTNLYGKYHLFTRHTEDSSFKLSENEMEDILSDDFMNYIFEIYLILHDVKDLYLFLHDFSLMGGMYISVFYDDMYEFFSYVRPIGWVLKNNGMKFFLYSTFETYKFDHLLPSYSEIEKLM